ncbi:MAG: NTP pyrophosphohydrolase [Microgenomates group bacterium GW2011_GWC1_41_8]|nr:MAG: NTP pyrophosphohydrolase [Candidatus Roizmanbacteria bacterium GW2011_GWA1_41_13]KKS23499.1 MAG: NTP pyrophosphohydrolase [Microgenomates group bacterium GW2011_GWC1_41_8]
MYNRRMPDEQVDIVNEQDEVLYSTSKQEAHKKGLLHRTVIAEVINSDGNWLLVKQSSNKQDAGQYVSPIGGHVQAGESTSEAIKREAFEELGISRFTFKLKGKCIYNRTVSGRKENHYFIIYEIRSDEKPILNEESESFKKFSPKELKTALRKSPEIFGDAFFPVIECCYPDLLKL